MSKMKVSIIIPVFNEEEHLSACLESIATLDYPSENVEVIVIDNGSTDSSREIAERFNARVLVDDTLKVSGLRNLGASESSGDVLAFVDADCTVSRDWLKNAKFYFEKKDVVAWGAPPELPDKATWIQRAWYLVRQKEKSVLEVEWLESMNIFVRKELFDSVGRFNESLVTCEDVDLSYRLREHGKMISDFRIRVVHHGEARTISEFMKKELWRGQGNFQGVLSHGLTLKELPSLLLPVYFGILIPLLFIVFVVMGNTNILLAALLCYSLPTLAVLLKVSRKRPALMDVIGLIFLVQFYFITRTVAVVVKT